MLFGLLLLGHGLEHIGRWSDVEDLDPIEPHPPFDGGVSHVVLHSSVDGLALESDSSRVNSPKTARSAVKDS